MGVISYSAQGTTLVLTSLPDPSQICITCMQCGRTAREAWYACNLSCMS